MHHAYSPFILNVTYLLHMRHDIVNDLLMCGFMLGHGGSCSHSNTSLKPMYAGRHTHMVFNTPTQNWRKNGNSESMPVCRVSKCRSAKHLSVNVNTICYSRLEPEASSGPESFTSCS